MKINKEQFEGDRHKEIRYVVVNKAALLKMKASEIKRSEPVSTKLSITKVSSNKSFLFENDENEGTLKRTIVANTYNWMDTHDDVLLNGVFAKSIKERGANAPHLHDHVFELSAKVGNPIRYYEAAINWKDVGLDIVGATESLFLESEILKEYNSLVYNEYLKGRINQHSVGLRYIKMALAVDDKDYEDEYKIWKSYIDQIGNKEKVQEQGYFFAVREAELIETSAVLLGANELTPTMFQSTGEDTGKSKSQKPVLDTKALFNAFAEALK
jgi:hypothetical protein